MKHRRIRRFIENRNGGALVELAIVFPILLLFAIGVVDFGRAYFKAITVSNAARAGAQKGAENEGIPAAAIQTAARNDAGDPTLAVSSRQFCRCPGGSSDVDCATTSCPGYGTSQMFIEVTASKTHSMMIGRAGLPSTIDVRRTAVFRIH